METHWSICPKCGEKKSFYSKQCQRCYLTTLWGENHPAWKGDSASLTSKHIRAQRRFSLGPCERCPEEGKHRHHKDRDPGNNAPGNIEILCPKCHVHEHLPDRKYVSRRWEKRKQIQAMPSLRLIINEELPSDLRAALDKDARNDNITVNDAAVRALSDHFQIEPQLSGFHYREVSQKFKLRVPDELHQLIRIQAAHRLQTVRGVALSELAHHYDVKPIDPGRRPRKVAA